MDLLGLDALGLALDAHVLALVFLCEVVLGPLPSLLLSRFLEKDRVTMGGNFITPPREHWWCRLCEVVKLSMQPYWKKNKERNPYILGTIVRSG